MKLNTKINKEDQASLPGMKSLFEMSKRLLAETDLKQLLAVAMDQVIEISGAEQGMILLYQKKDDFTIQTARNLRKEDIENPDFQISRTIIQRVRRSGSAVCLANALESSDYKQKKSVTHLKILSVICLPLKQDEETFGAIYLDNRTVRGVFSKETFSFIKEFGDFISLAAYRTLERQQMTDQICVLEKQLRAEYDFQAILGHSPKMVEILNLISRVADTQATVLIEGETGTGKELVARAIHMNSTRKAQPLLAINCAAIPENLLESELFGHKKGAFTGACKDHKGRFEQADKGTLFLDEIDEMSPGLQVKLLRILQWGEYTPLGSEEKKTCDVRIIAAAKQSVLHLVETDLFRDDLYYRLNCIRIELPPLRERRTDIMLLAHHFLAETARGLSREIPAFSPAAQQMLSYYDFPGNVRELESIIHRAVILCDGSSLEPEHLPGEVHKSSMKTKRIDMASDMPFKDAKRQIIADFEKQYLIHLLDESGGVIRKAAKRAEMHEKNFYQKMMKYGLSRKNYK